MCERMGITEIVDAYEDYLKISTKIAVSTVTKYRNIARLFLISDYMTYNKQGRPIITIDAINRWISYKNKSKSTYHYKYAMRHFLISIGRPDMAEKLVPAKKQKRKKVFKFVSKDRMERIINLLDKDVRKIVFLQLKTGARIGSILTIRAENIDFKINDNFIYIRIGVGLTKIKGEKKEHTLKLSRKYEPLLRSWIKRPYGYIFLDEKCENYDEEKINNHIVNMTNKINEKLRYIGTMHGIDALSTHYLRHIFSDWFLKAGGDPTYLQKVLGHSKIETTQRYVSIADQMAEQTLIHMEDG